MSPETFTEKEKIIGYVQVDSGNLLLVDGVWDGNLVGVSPKNKCIIDIERDKVRLPIIASRQNGCRFLLIPIDSAETISVQTAETVEIIEPDTKKE